jgi:hypothetical protein
MPGGNMPNAVEEAKKIVGQSYTASNAKQMQAIVPGQEVEVLSKGYVRSAGGKTTYVVVDDAENVIAIVVGDGQ